MPKPTASDVHVNRPLTNVSVAYMQDENAFVARKVFPVVPVAKQSDAYFEYDRAYWNADEMQVRISGAESAGNGYAVDGTTTYFAKSYAFHKDIPDDVRSNADSGINLDREATIYCTQKALIKMERVFVTNFFAGSVWTRDYDGVASATPGANQVTQWSDYTNSTPIEDVWDAKEAILESTGQEGNTLVLGYPVYKTLVNHPDFVDRVKYGNTSGVAMIDTSEMAQVFKVDRVLVMRSIYNTAAEEATASHSFIGGKKALLVHAAPSPGLMTPSGGYTFAWTGKTGATPDGTRIKRFRIEEKEVDRVEIEAAFDMKKISADLGAFWDVIVA